MAINVSATPLVVTLGLRQVVLSHFPAAPRDPDLNQWLTLGYASPTDTAITLTLYGTWGSFAALDTTLDVALTLLGTYEESVTAVSSPLGVTLTIYGDFISELPKSNWIKWSNIGALDFTIWKDNVAGERPLELGGWIYAIRKLDKQVMVYGERGVSVMIPDYTRWGLKTISRVGLKSKMAICGNDSVHFYVDILNRLCKISEKIEVLGYDEFIGTLSDSVVLSYDEQLQRVFICDGQLGYVYSSSDGSLGRGPGNITGYAQGLIAAAATIESFPFEICSDIYDLGSRKDKTIMEVELGIDCTYETYVAIDWRKDKTSAFTTTQWTKVNPNGRANLPCWGREFRIRIKQLVYDDIKLDYIKVLGQLHNYSFLDSFLRGRQV